MKSYLCIAFALFGCCYSLEAAPLARSLRRRVRKRLLAGGAAHSAPLESTFGDFYCHQFKKGQCGSGNHHCEWRDDYWLPSGGGCYRSFPLCPLNSDGEIGLCEKTGNDCLKVCDEWEKFYHGIMNLNATCMKSEAAKCATLCSKGFAASDWNYEFYMRNNKNESNGPRFEKCEEPGASINQTDTYCQQFDEYPCGFAGTAGEGCQYIDFDDTIPQGCHRVFPYCPLDDLGIPFSGVCEKTGEYCKAICEEWKNDIFPSENPGMTLNGTCMDVRTTYCKKLCDDGFAASLYDDARAVKRSPYLGDRGAYFTGNLTYPGFETCIVSGGDAKSFRALPSRP